jgi:hypothetical protein
MITVTIIRTTATSPISTDHKVSVPNIEAAVELMALYTDDTDMISFSVEGTQWLGSGIAGSGRFEHSVQV